MSKLRFKKRGLPGIDKKAENKALEAHKELIAAARSCFSNESFQKYLKQYEIAEEKTMNALFYIDQHEDDPFKYMVKIKTLLTELRTIRTMKLNVEADARIKKDLETLHEK